MGEKEIAVGKPSYSTRRLLLFIGLLLIVIALVMYGLNVGDCREHTYKTYSYYKNNTMTDTISYSLLEIVFPPYWEQRTVIVGAILDIGIIITIIGFIMNIALSKVSITVTNKRVYGTSTWGKRVDLPLDSISAVAISAFKGIAVATSSGKINFKAIENNVEVFKAISELLIKRQNKETDISVTATKHEPSQSNADELKKFKELLDSGVITQEEFDAKKKQLLGL